MATNQDKKINEYKKNPTVAESAYVVGLNSNDENINIPRATLAEIVRQELYSILNASAADQGTTVTKVPVLGGNRIGSSSIADLASVLGVESTPLVQNSSITVPRARAYMLIKSATDVLSIIKTGPTVASSVVLDFGKESKDVDYTIEVNADQTTTITNNTAGNLTVKRIV